MTKSRIDALRGTKPKRFLVVKFGSLGDIVHCLPSVAQLRRAFPDAEIDWLIERRRAYRACGTQFLALAATNAFLTEVLQKCRRDPQMAGYALVTLGNMNPQSDAAHQIQKTLISALKLN